MSRRYAAGVALSWLAATVDVVARVARSVRWTSS